VATATDDKAGGTKGYDARALAEEANSLVAELGLGHGKPIIHAVHDMGALPALLWSADHPSEVAEGGNCQRRSCIVLGTRAFRRSDCAEEGMNIFSCSFVFWRVKKG
jgi:hypothetical protein